MANNEAGHGPVKVEGEAGERIQDILSRVNNPAPLLVILGRLGLASVRQNFADSGRPEKWADVEASRPGGDPLRDSGRMMNSFSRNSSDLIWEAEDYSLAFGTNVEYAGVHNFGYTGSKTVAVRQHTRTTKSGKKSTVKSHSRNQRWNIKARPFMMLQDHDVDDFAEETEDYVMGGE